jgi:hypothetical protein
VASALDPGVNHQPEHREECHQGDEEQPSPKVCQRYARPFSWGNVRSREGTIQHIESGQYQCHG